MGRGIVALLGRGFVLRMRIVLRFGGGGCVVLGVVFECGGVGRGGGGAAGRENVGAFCIGVIGRCIWMWTLLDIKEVQ